MNATSQIDTLIELSGRLARLLESESEHLRAMRLSDLAELQEEKAKLAAAYAGAFESVRDNPSAVREAEAGLRAALKDATGGLRETIGANVRAITAAKTINERLVRALSEAVASTLMPLAAYTATGGTAPASSLAGQVPLAIDNQI